MDTALIVAVILLVLVLIFVLGSAGSPPREGFAWGEWRENTSREN